MDLVPRLLGLGVQDLGLVQGLGFCGGGGAMTEVS